jgi:hypothetical protein
MSDLVVVTRPQSITRRHMFISVITKASVYVFFRADGGRGPRGKRYSSEVLPRHCFNLKGRKEEGREL